MKALYTFNALKYTYAISGKKKTKSGILSKTLHSAITNKFLYCLSQLSLLQIHTLKYLKAFSLYCFDFFFKGNFTSYKITTSEKNISMQSNFVISWWTMFRWIFKTLLIQNFVRKTQPTLCQDDTVLNEQYLSTTKHTHYELYVFSICLIHLYY